MQKFGAETARGLRASFSSAFGGVAEIATVGGIAAIGAEVLATDKALTRLGIQAGVTRSDIMAFNREVLDTSDDVGVSAKKLSAAATTFVSKTGDFETARKVLGLLGETAQASGAQVEDVGAAASSLRTNLGITEVDEMRSALSGLLAQGKAGKVELREMAALLPSIAPQFVEFGRDGAEGVAELGAAMQVVSRGFNTGSEAATGLANLMAKISANAAKLDKAGVNVFADGDQTTLRGFTEIIEDISKAEGLQ
ncbi:MAG: phage tail tape measure protein, partial [Solirubrobacterales bacterium]